MSWSKNFFRRSNSTKSVFFYFWSLHAIVVNKLISTAMFLDIWGSVFLFRNVGMEYNFWKLFVDDDISENIELVHIKFVLLFIILCGIHAAFDILKRL